MFKSFQDSLPQGPFWNVCRFCIENAVWLCIIVLVATSGIIYRNISVADINNQIQIHAAAIKQQSAQVRLNIHYEPRPK